MKIEGSGGDKGDEGIGEIEEKAMNLDAENEAEMVEMVEVNAE